MELEPERCPICGGFITIDNRCSDCPYTIHEWDRTPALAMADELLGMAYAYQNQHPNSEAIASLVKHAEELARKVGLE